MNRTAPPPQAIEAEEGLLGALLHRAPFGRDLPVAAFYRDSHRTIFRAIKKVEAPDPVTVAAALKESGDLEKAGGRAYLQQLASMTPALGMAEHYASVVWTAWQQREAIEAAHGLVNANGDFEKVLPRTIETLQALTIANAGDGVRVTRASDVERERVEWLWLGRIPYGGVTLLAGDPGLGKSVLSCQLAANASARGDGVLMATAEDSLGATMKPRLEAAGADLERVAFIEMRRDGVTTGIAIPDDADALRLAAESVSARLIVIDPLMAHLPGGVDSHKDQSIRRALAPLHRIGEDLDCAVLVVAHLNKGQAASVLGRVGGSIGLTGAARSALLLAKEPRDGDEDNGRRVLAHFKANLSAKAPSLLYAIEPVQLPPTDGEPAVDTLRLLEVGECDYTGDDLLESRTADERGAQGDAEDYLRTAFEDSRRLSTGEVTKDARQLGITDSTLRRARVALGIKTEKEGYGKGSQWFWVVPEGGLLAKKPGAQPTKETKPDEFLGDVPSPSAKERDKDPQTTPKASSLKDEFFDATPEQEEIAARLAAGTR